MVWHKYLETFGLILNNGQTCSAGTSVCDKSYIFDPSKKITKIVCIDRNDEVHIAQINFFSGEDRLVAVGTDDENAKQFCEKVEVFEIADDEQLIGCKLDQGVLYGMNYFLGITLIKMKVRF